MKRKDFIKDSVLAGIVLSMPDLIQSFTNADKNSPYLKITCASQSPQFSFFSIDSLGKNNLHTNVILPEELPPLYEASIEGNHAGYRLSGGILSWELIKSKSAFRLISHHAGDQPFVFSIEQHVNHCTLLGMMNGEPGIVSLPAILHLPDMGTLRITSNQEGKTVRCTSQRFIDHPYEKIFFPCTEDGKHALEYQFEVITIHPELKNYSTDGRFDGFRKNFISIFQLNPLLRILSNNSSSDACAFTLYKYAKVAAITPPLAKGLTALDLVRMTLDRYLQGQLGYGMLGYDYDKKWDIPETATTCPTADSYPSLLISACTYILATGDNKWFENNNAGLNNWIGKVNEADHDHDGLIEFCLSGNTGSWKGDKTQRPSNWWDTIGFGHKDAYANALVYHAWIQLEEVNRRYGSTTEAQHFRELAALLKSRYTETFYNPETGVLAGWRSADGQLHDYYFTFVNAVAISFGLIENDLANSIMDKLLAKMEAVGFTNFELGMPGNLIPVKRADYTDLLLEVGGGKREDNQDGFQIYENGGATACFTYFTIHALQKLGRIADADKILFPLLKSLAEGNFQGRCSNGRSKDWKTWTGECWGYEGFLVDNYMFLLAVAERFSKDSRRVLNGH